MPRAVNAAVFLGLLSVAAHIAAQGPPAQPTPAGGQAPAAGQPPGGRGREAATFPAQQRPPGDPALVQRGQQIYGVNCRLCHGPDLRGGDLGGVNLLRSQLVLNDQKGELILPVVRNGRITPGMQPMPPFPQLADEDVRALAEYIHSVAATMRRQGAPPPGSEPEALNILVGDAAAGQAYFAARCASCHSPTGDLQGVAARIADPVQLQNTWVSGGVAGGRGGRGRGAAPVSERRQVRVRVTEPSGQTVSGTLGRLDDFIVVVNLPDGTQRSFGRNGDAPRVELDDPLEGHRRLLSVYTDKDIHDVTAYLVTLK